MVNMFYGTATWMKKYTKFVKLPKLNKKPINT